MNTRSFFLSLALCLTLTGCHSIVNFESSLETPDFPKSYSGLLILRDVNTKEEFKIKDIESHLSYDTHMYSMDATIELQGVPLNPKEGEAPATLTIKNLNAHEFGDDFHTTGDTTLWVNEQAYKVTYCQGGIQDWSESKGFYRLFLAIKAEGFPYVIDYDGRTTY